MLFFGRFIVTSDWFEDFCTFQKNVRYLKKPLNDKFDKQLVSIVSGLGRPFHHVSPNLLILF